MNMEVNVWLVSKFMRLRFPRNAMQIYRRNSHGALGHSSIMRLDRRGIISTSDQNINQKVKRNPRKHGVLEVKLRVYQEKGSVNYIK